MEMPENLFNKVWKLHSVRTLANGQTQLFVGLHLIHEVTSPQAFAMLRENNLTPRYPSLAIATSDHIVPTDSVSRPFSDPLAETMMQNLEKNVKDNNINFFGVSSQKQGIVHVIGPELGFTQPGMVICCGDSHTSTHGAFGAIAFGIGTTQVRDILATQTIALTKPKVRKVVLNGRKQKGVYAKDIALNLMRSLGVNGGIGYAYEYAGTAVKSMSMDERMTLCNMSIEGGARCGYVNPDETTFKYLRGKPYAPKGNDYDKAELFWRQVSTDSNAGFDDVVSIDVNCLEPTVTWGTNPGQAIGISERVPDPKSITGPQASEIEKALGHMKLEPGQPIKGVSIDVAFIGSCTNSRISDLREAAMVVKGKKIKQGVKALVVPGSQQVALQAQKEGLDKVFTDAGFEWRKPGCSMCLAMNPDRLTGGQACASSSNRNFIGRQGSATGRTFLMSPAMVAAAAIHGEISDVRQEYSNFDVSVSEEESL